MRLRTSGLAALLVAFGSFLSLSACFGDKQEAAEPVTPASQGDTASEDPMSTTSPAVEEDGVKKKDGKHKKAGAHKKGGKKASKKKKVN